MAQEEVIDEEDLVQVQQKKDADKLKESIALKEQQAKTTQFSGVKTTLFKDPNTLERYPIPVSMSPMPTVDRILTYVDRTGFCGILCIGMSGTGKSTLAKYLVHQIHQRKNFVVHHYSRDDIQRMDKHIANLQRGTPAILIFDDASFSLDQLKKEQINKIAQHLTYVRHDVRAPVIVIMNIHYSKAISRFFRNVPFAFLTSITQEEAHTFQDVWPHGRWKFKDFAWYYQQMMFNNKWTFEVDRWNKRTYTYFTDKPFRLGLALEGNMIHFFVYLKDGCTICDPEYSIKKITNSKDLVDHYIKSYGVARARSMLKMYAFARHGLKVIDKNRYAIWRSISEFDTNNRINWNNVVAELDKTVKKRKRSYIKKVDEEIDRKQLEQVRVSAEQQEVEMKEELEHQLDDLKERQKLVDPKLDMGFDPDSQNPNEMPYGEGEAYGQGEQGEPLLEPAVADPSVEQVQPYEAIGRTLTKRRV